MTETASRSIFGGIKMNIQFKQPVQALAFHTPTLKAQPFAKRNDEPKDTLSIGQQARHLFNQQASNNSLIENLMKQREQVLEMKNSLTERALEKGENPSSLQEQMKQFEQQLADLDAQIAQAQKEKQTAPNEQPKKEKPKSVEEAIFSQSGSLEQMQIMQQTERSLSREKISLESEMKLDATRGVYSEAKASRITEIDDQMTFVQETLTQQVSSTSANESFNPEESEELTIQEKLNEIAEKEQDAEIISNHQNTEA